MYKYNLKSGATDVTKQKFLAAAIALVITIGTPVAGAMIFGGPDSFPGFSNPDENTLSSSSDRESASQTTDSIKLDNSKDDSNKSDQDHHQSANSASPQRELTQKPTPKPKSQPSSPAQSSTNGSSKPDTGHTPTITNPLPLPDADEDEPELPLPDLPDLPGTDIDVEIDPGITDDPLLRLRETDHDGRLLR